MPRVGREVRALMLELTPLVEPLSIDEAFLDLAGTERLHQLTPAQTLARFARRVEQEIGITVSIGLSANKFLAKLASDLDKPRGFAVLGRAESRGLPGAAAADGDLRRRQGDGGPAGARRLPHPRRPAARRRARTDAPLRHRGPRLARLARGIDARPVRADREAKSISAETTFEQDIADFTRAGAVPVAAHRAGLGATEGAAPCRARP